MSVEGAERKVEGVSKILMSQASVSLGPALKREGCTRTCLILARRSTVITWKAVAAEKFTNQA